MNRFAPLGLLALLLFAFASSSQAQVTGLSEWSLYLDPGHSGINENVGIYGYSEPQKVLRVGLALKEMLETRTDIEAVHISRTSDADQVGLSQRSDEANALGVDFFHSIHSNAGGSSTNNTLMLHGGWRSGGQTVEKTPMGGGRMGDEYIRTLTAAMRIPTIGNFADRTFYQGFPDNHTNQFPYLSVNRRTNMASVLSEGGFHTNPRQNTLNMNADWKRLEAQAHYWAILDWHGVTRSTHRIATGIVTDVESGRPINGATITIDGQTYTTDTYDSLFNAYSDDPNELANGFYYLEDLGAGTHTVTVTADDYGTFTGSIMMNDTTFTFLDAQLTSTLPPTVVASDPEGDEPAFRITDDLTVTFSRPMDPATTAPAVSLELASGGAVSGTATVQGTTLRFNPDATLDPLTSHTLTIAGTATALAGDALDGDGDGTGGDGVSIVFTTGFADTSAPLLTEAYPAPSGTDVELRPVITVGFNEAIVPATLEGRVSLREVGSGDVIAGQYEHALAAVVGDDPQPQSTVSFVPDADLSPDTRYRFDISAGIEDAFANVTSSPFGFTFRTGTEAPAVTEIDDFEGSSIADNWWLPEQSGSTTGIDPDSTALTTASDRVSPLGGTSAMRIEYGWDDGAGPWLIREYLAGGPPRSVFFDTEVTLQAYVFGDGTGTLFRFAIDDGSQHEVSPWVSVDWVGWRPVSWDLDQDGFGTWIGNGTIDAASVRFDSFQLSRATDGPRYGELVVDDLRVLRSMSVSTEDELDETAPLVLLPNRPNPFRETTILPFALRSPAQVTARVFNTLGQEVAMLATGTSYGAGTHELVWDAREAASGVYFVRVETEAAVETLRIVLAR
ncbi:MAG: hypothetical protein Rubg2KO_36050 [Rubricoccaceae bacterium]